MTVRKDHNQRRASFMSKENSLNHTRELALSVFEPKDMLQDDQAGWVMGIQVIYEEQGTGRSQGIRGRQQIAFDNRQQASRRLEDRRVPTAWWADRAKAGLLLLQFELTRL